MAHIRCGVAIGIAWRRARPEHVKSMFNPPDALRGRVGAMRVKNSMLDITPIVAYFPAWPANACKTTLRTLPLRTMPILVVDLNGRVGAQRKPGVL